MLLAFFVFFALVRGFDGQNDFPGHLPGETIPDSYSLSINPNIENASFAGIVEISIRVKTTTSTITLNSKDLVWNNVEILDDATLWTVGVKSWNQMQDQERMIIFIDGHVLANRKYILKIWFEGKLRDDSTGLFKGFYTSGLNDKKWFIATQFQPTYARSAFPCYDEPAYRATFNISLKIQRKNNEIALSNMPIAIAYDVTELISKDSKTYQNSTWIYFKQTPPISTCSVAFFVGDFEYLDNAHENPINVYSHLGSLYQIENASDMSSDLLNVMEEYTNVSSAMVKLDIIAVPELDIEAVDNWGLNIYREKSIFINKNTKTKRKISVKMTIVRMMAHQWFGNLVTPIWWDYAWLSEGFSTYFEYFTTAKLESQWHLDNFFVIEKQQTALEYDQTPKHPLSSSIRKSTQLSWIYDIISNAKGAAILKMLENWVGEELFRKALNTYLIKNKYSIVRPDHLWNSFDNAIFDEFLTNNSSLNNYTIFTIMNPWVEQPGYPVVNIMKESQLLVLTQERFSINKSANTNDTSKWHIRLSYTTDMETNFDTVSTSHIWMDPAENETVIDINDEVQWYIFNIQSTGFYRVNYMEDNWLSLIEQLNDLPTNIHVINRARLIDDAFNLARAGQLNYNIPLRLTEYLIKEEDIIPWFSAMNCLNYVLERMRRSENGYADVKAFVSELAGIAFSKMHKIVTEKRDSRYLIKVGWNAFSTWACKLDNVNCTKPALKYFRRWQNGEEIPADIKDAAFCVGIKSGIAAEVTWTQMLNVYKSTKTYSEKESALNALACTDNVNLLTTLLQLILKNKCPIQPQDYKTFFDALSLTPSGINALTLFLQNNLRDIAVTVKNGENMITTIYSILASKVSTRREIYRLKKVMSTYTMSDELSSMYRDLIEDNEIWFFNNSITIREFVNPGSTNETTPSTVTTTVTPPNAGSKASSKFHNFAAIILQAIALSVLVKLTVFVNMN